MSLDLYIDFKTAANVRGATPSSLVHQFVTGVVRDEQSRNPQLFDLKREEMKREVEVHSAAKRQPKTGNSN